jgi:hypothetical protein
VSSSGEDDHSATLTPLLGIALPQRRHRDDVVASLPAEPALWFVTVTVGGPRVSGLAVREALERLSEWQPFLVSAGYASGRAEVRYWDESVDIEGSVGQALRLTGEFLERAGLSSWRVVGLEVVDRATARRRWAADVNVPTGNLGVIRPLDGD